MRTLLSTAQEFPTLLFDADMARAGQLAARLQECHTQVVVALSTDDALRRTKHSEFRVLVVTTRPSNRESLDFLSALRRAAPRSWVVAISPKINPTAEALLRRFGADAVVSSPVNVPELARRISLLQVRSRPSF
jgi:DNA-binding response OmpR family regulator